MLEALQRSVFGSRKRVLGVWRGLHAQNIHGIPQITTLSPHYGHACLLFVGTYVDYWNLTRGFFEAILKGKSPLRSIYGIARHPTPGM